MASPVDSKADDSEMVVMLNEPLRVVGDPSYIYWTLWARLTVREALRSIFRSRMGSTVALTCKSSEVDEVNGVATESVISQ